MARHYLLTRFGATALVLGCNSDPALGGSDDGTAVSSSITGDSSGTTAQPPVTDSSLSSEATSDSSSSGATSTGTTTSTTTSSSSASSTSVTTSSETDPSSTGETDTGGVAHCGDGVVAGEEECDDGNGESFDGCSAGCTVERAIAQVCAGASRTCVVDDLGRLKCWGANLYGELGIGDKGHRGDDPGEMGAALPFIDLDMKVASVACRNNFCALGTEGQVKCWGGPAGNYLGLGTNEAIGDQPGEMGAALPAVELGEPALQLANSGRGACALLSSGKLKCWGNNEDGQLGLGDTETRGDQPGEMGMALLPVQLGQFKPMQLISGDQANCAINATGGMKCWGFSRLLGLEDDESRGDEVGEMGDALPLLNLGIGAKVSQASGPIGHACAVLTDGRLKCWGSDMGTYVLWPFGLNTPWYGWKPGQMGDNLPAYDLGAHKAIAVESGYQSSCVLLDDQSVRCWGVPYKGIMGNGSSAEWLGDPLIQVPAIELGAGEVVKQFSHSFQHACALLSSGNVKCWGSNDGGELGYEDNNNRGDEPDEMGDALPYVEIF